MTSSNPYLDLAKNLEKAKAADPQNPQKGAYGGFGGTPGGHIREFLPAGLVGRLMLLIRAGALTVGQADEVCERYWNNPDVWQSRVVSAERTAGLLRCHECCSYRTPGLTGPYGGYCGGRDDLPPAYGDSHPLRRLPDDGGHGCENYREAKR